MASARWPLCRVIPIGRLGLDVPVEAYCVQAGAAPPSLRPGVHLARRPSVVEALESCLGDRAFGVYNYTGPYIFISGLTPKHRAEGILLHEAAHALLHRLGDDAKQSEAAAQLVADFLVRFYSEIGPMASKLRRLLR